MDSFKRTIDSILTLLLQIGDLIVAGIVAIELWLRGQLGQFGLPPGVQTTILVALAALTSVFFFILDGEPFFVVIKITPFLPASP